MLVIVLSGLAYTSVRPFGRSAGPQMALREQEQAIEQQRDSLKLTLERDEIKRRLLRICAACNRGFGASDNDRTAVNTLLRELEPMSPCDAPTAGVADSNNAPWLGRGLENSNWNDGTVANGPLEGVWRLIYTDARDVLSLDANPFASVGPISQEITLPASVVNVIELVPRVSSLLPPGALRTATTIRVGTRAKARSATRVGLTFETVGAEQQALLGVDVRKLLPPLSLPLPRPPWSDRAGADDEASPAYFEIPYIDNDCLVVAQNSPGGVFVFVRETPDELRMRTDPRSAAAPPPVITDDDVNYADEDFPGATG